MGKIGGEEEEQVHHSHMSTSYTCFRLEFISGHSATRENPLNLDMWRSIATELH